MPAEAETLLAAEQAASQLLDELQRLRDEVVNYSTVRNDLEAVRQTLTLSAEQLKELAAKSGLVIATMSEVGTPAILERLTGIQQQYATMQTMLTDLKNDTDGGFSSVAKHLQTSADAVQSHGESLKAIITSTSQESQEQITVLRCEIEKLNSNLSSHYRTLRMLLIVALLFMLGGILLNLPIIQKMLFG